MKYVYMVVSAAIVISSLVIGYFLLAYLHRDDATPRAMTTTQLDLVRAELITVKKGDFIEFDGELVIANVGFDQNGYRIACSVYLRPSPVLISQNVDADVRRVGRIVHQTDKQGWYLAALGYFGIGGMEK